MTKKEAYCCVDCRVSANCCAECDKCTACCEDCEIDPREYCPLSAYFGKDNKIYKEYTATYFSWGTNYNWLADGEFETGNINGRYSSRTNETLKHGSSTFNTWLCGECLCGAGPDVSYTKSTTIYDGKIATTETERKGSCRDCDDPPCDENTFGGGCSCEAEYKNSSKGGVGGIPIIDADAPSCNMLKDDTHDSGGTVTFTIPLKTYNSLGEVVADPIPNGPYDPCNPIRRAYAPGCHFFAP